MVPVKYENFDKRLVPKTTTGRENLQYSLQTGGSSTTVKLTTKKDYTRGER